MTYQVKVFFGEVAATAAEREDLGLVYDDEQAEALAVVGGLNENGSATATTAIWLLRGGLT